MGLVGRLINTAVDSAGQFATAAVGTADNARGATRAVAAKAPDAARAPRAASAARDGVAALANGPITFAGVRTGDTFDVVRGSKLGSMRVTGSSEVASFSPQRAQFKAKLGPFGMVRATTTIERLPDGQARITTSGKGIPKLAVDATVIRNEPDLLSFQHVGQPKTHRTTFQRTGPDSIEMKSMAPGIGQVLLKMVSS